MDTEPTESELQDAKRCVRALAACPTDWDSITPQGCGDLVEGLLAEWHEVAEKYSTYGEIGRFYAGQLELDSIETEHSVTDLRDDERRIKTWIEAARREYCALTAPFRNLHIDTNKYEKHKAKKKLTRQQIIETTDGRTNEDGSLFFAEVDDKLIEEMMWFVIDAGYGDRIEQVLKRKHVRIVSAATAQIGAARGHATNLICWDISFAGSGVHPFPVLEKDVPGAPVVHTLPDIFDYLLGSGE